MQLFHRLDSTNNNNLVWYHNRHRVTHLTNCNTNSQSCKPCWLNKPFPHPYHAWQLSNWHSLIHTPISANMTSSLTIMPWTTTDDLFIIIPRTECGIKKTNSAILWEHLYIFIVWDGWLKDSAYNFTWNTLHCFWILKQETNYVWLNSSWGIASQFAMQF